MTLRICIAGGYYLEHSHQVKIIEHSLERCTTLSERLDRTWCFTAAPPAVAGRGEFKIFCALTNDDEVYHVVAARQAFRRQEGADADQQRPYDLVQGGEIDIAISSRRPLAAC